MLTNLPTLQFVSLRENYIDLSSTGICAGAIQVLRERGVTLQLENQKPFRTVLFLRKTPGGLALDVDSTPTWLAYRVYWSSDLKTWQLFVTQTGSDSFPIPADLKNYPQVFFRATR